MEPAMEIRLRFTSRVDRRLSRVQLMASNGTSADLFIATDQAPDVIAVKANDLGPGNYLVRWQVMGVDGHINQGDIPLDVKR
jgi:copper resistance protein C